MRLQDAIDVFEGRKLLRDIPQTTMGEDLMLLMGACIDEYGDIKCLTCGLPNECCNCEQDEWIKAGNVVCPVP